MADYIRITRRKDKLRMKLAELVPGLNDAIDEANGQNATELAEAVSKRAPRSAGAPSHGGIHYADTIVAKPIDENASRADQSIMTTYRATAKSGPRKGQTVTRKARAGDILAWGLFASYIWRWLEHGTKNMRAQPHIFPTYRSMKKRFRSRMGRAVRKAVKKVAEK